MATSTRTTGLRLRPYAGEADLVEIVRLENAEAAADGLQRRTSVEELGAYFAHPNASFDPARDVTMAEIDGRVVAVGAARGHRHDRRPSRVPARRDRRSRVAAPRHRSRRPRRERAPSPRELAALERPASPILGSWSWESQVGDVALLESRGLPAGALVLRHGPSDPRCTSPTSRSRTVSRSARSTPR